MNGKKTVDVSIVAANYNNAPYLREFINSIWASTVKPLEVIIVDDGSTDDSRRILEAAAAEDGSIRLLPLEKNMGFGNALNIGINASCGKYILRVDPDDLLFPCRLEIQSRALDEGSCDIVGSNAQMFHTETGKRLGTSNFPLTHAEIASRIKKGEHGVLHPTVMGHSSLFKKHKYVQKNVPAEDYDIFARMLLDGAVFLNFEEPLISYRIHESSASNKLPFSTVEKTFKIRDELFLEKTGKLKIVLYYGHIKAYRKSLFCRGAIHRCLWVLFSAALYPSKALSRIRRGLA